MKFRALIATALAAGLLVSTAQVALGDTTLKSGTLYCGVQKVPISYATGYGHFFLSGPGSTKTYYRTGGMSYTTKYESGNGGFWEAGLWGSGSLKTSQTGAYCSGM